MQRFYPEMLNRLLMAWGFVLPAVFLLPACGVLSHDRQAVTCYFQAVGLYSELAASQGREPHSLSESDQERVDRINALIEESIALNPFFPPSHKLAIDMARLSGDEKRVPALFGRAIALFPDEADLRIALGQIYFSGEGKESEAIELILDGLKRDPRNTMLRQTYVEMLAATDGSAQEIQDHLLTTLRLPDLPLEFYARAAYFTVVLADSGYKPVAIDILLRLSAQTESGLCHGFDLAMETGLQDQACELTEEALRETEPPPPALLFAGARMYTLLEDYSKAEDLLAGLEPDDSDSDLLFGAQVKALEAWIMMGQGDPARAKDVLFAILDDHPSCFVAVEALLATLIRYPSLIDRKRLVDTLRDIFPDIEDPIARNRLIQAVVGLSR